MEVKEILYNAIKNYGEQKIVSDIIQGHSPETINTICDDCISFLEDLENKPEAMVSFAEAFVHYLLTVALIQSQRKTSHEYIDIDVVIPDISTLKTSSHDALIIMFPKTSQIQDLKKYITDLAKIQPHKENTWFVLENEAPLEVRTYDINRSGKFPFSNIINDIIQFLSNKKQSNLKIFKI